MSYFDRDFLRFFEELAGDNSKQRFDEHRPRYHTIVKDPWYAFLQACITEIAKTKEEFSIEPKHAVFRINRDIRFSKNKQPYKTNVSAILSSRWRKDMDYPWLYVQLGQAWLHLWCGTYKPPKEHLKAIRSKCIAQQKKVEAIFSDIEPYFGDLQWEKNKRIPKEFRESLTSQSYIANKQFYFYRQFPSQYIFKEDLVEFILEYWHAAKPWNDFLIDCLAE